MNSKFQKVSLLKRPNSRTQFWYLRWFEETPEGVKERWKSTRKVLKREAEVLRSQLERELEEGGGRSQRSLTWKQFQEDFLESHTRRKPGSTLKTYRTSLEVFGKLANVRQVSEVDFGCLEDFVKSRLKSGAAPATVNRDLRHVRAALKWAERRKFIDKAPDFHGLFVREELKNPVVVPREDFAAMVAALKSENLKLKTASPDWWKIFLYLSYYLGLRRNETLSLTWSDVSLETMEVRVMAATSKGRRERMVPIAPEIRNLLQQWKQQYPSAGLKSPVLPWDHDSYFPLYGDWHAIQTAGGIPEGQHYVPKNFRSTCASDLIASNVPTVVVKDFLGHATVATTETYYINTKPALRAAAQAREVYTDPSDSQAIDA